MSRVDVVVPCYNYARFLDRCVESLLGQDGAEVRILVIDDASTDDTPAVGARLAAADARVTFRRHPVNQGHIATYNEGLLGWADAEYALLISADDVVAPGAFRRAIAFLDRHPEAGMVYGMARVIIDDAGPPAETGPVPAESRIVGGADFLRHCCERAHCPVSTPTAVVRTTVQQTLGGYAADLPHSADLEMWMRFAMRGPIGVLRSVQAYYRWHASNMASRYYNQRLGDRQEFLLTCHRMLGRSGERYPGAAPWMVSMHRLVAEEAVHSANKCFDLGDDESSRAWLALARELDPTIRSTRAWWRSRAGRLLGRPLVNAIRPVLHRLRGLPPQPPVTIDATHFRGFRPGEFVGWWPETP
ncbi:MAG: glycosyltransferase family 2 protein [Candidatus Eisenbacteria bacterium]